MHRVDAGCDGATARRMRRADGCRGRGAQPSEPEVSVVTVRPQPRAVVRELPGRIAPTRVAEVRPRVSGIVVERLFHQGSEVKAGDPLYRIDPRPFEVEVQSTEAALAQGQGRARSGDAARAAHRDADQPDARPPRPRTKRPSPRMRQAEADVEARKADVARAKLNLDYATIRAPIDGVVGARAGQRRRAGRCRTRPRSLATIQQLDPIYADFTQSVTELNQLRRAFESGDLDRIAPDAAKVRLRARRRRRSIRCPASCCSRTPRSMPTPGR